MGEEEIIRASNNFAATVYDTLRQANDNIILSPLSLHQLLTLVSQDPGYDQHLFAQRLNIYESDQPVKHHKGILTYLNSNIENLRITSKAVVKDNYELRERFRNLLIQDFNNELASLNLNNTESTARSINAWVEEKSHNKVKEFTNSNILHNETRLALLNIMDFGGKWALPFNADDTSPATFHISHTETVEVPMMKIKTEVNYTYVEYINLQILELPYTNNDVSLFVFLPNKETNLKDISIHNVIYHINNMAKEELNISLPKFNIKKCFDLKSSLMKMGFENELCENTNLFGMINSEDWMSVDKINEAGVFSINEEGSESASGTIFTFVPNKADDKEYPPEDGLVIYEMEIKSNVSNRFAKNLVICKVRNTNKSAKEATFKVILPETAFITEFLMEIEGKTYKSYIKGKEEAKVIYNEAVSSGRSAGIVEASARDSNEFNVSVNLEPESVAMFSLTYEQMLQRIHDQYELVLNIQPGQIVEKLNVEVNINESRPLKFVKTPPLRSGKEMNKNEEYLQPSSDIKIDSKSASVKFSPDAKQQKRIAGYLGTKLADGFSGQFVVQYDVERDPQNGEILLQDGYFVHFFASNDLDPLPKHVVFVLDTSGSMSGRKISQLKDAMISILNEIRKNDVISLIEFNSDVIVWDINSEKSTALEYTGDDKEPLTNLSASLPSSAYANEETINKAKNVVQKIEADGSTFMSGGLQTALYLVKREQKRNADKTEKHQPIIVFLTDGQPNVGIMLTEEIVKITTEQNLKNNKVPIFSLSFGSGADKEFLRKLSLKNLGFSRHIYEASDASLQLQAFYKQISSPLLTDVKFKYDSEVKDVTRSLFPIYFRGAELVVSGRYSDSSFSTVINCCGPSGPVVLKSVIERPVTPLERLWAYLTVRQLLEEKDSAENKTELIKRATELALKYSFVTDVTSLVVVKPNETNAVSTGGEEQPGNIPLAMDGRFQALTLCAAPANYLQGITDDSNDPTGLRSIKWKKRKCGKNIRYMEVLTAEDEEETTEPEKLIPREFVADHPFIIVLALKKGDERIILFMGSVHKPC